MHLRLPAALVAVATILPFAAHAEGPSYSYADLAYVTTDLDGVDEELDGFRLSGSVEVTDQVFLFGSYADQSAEVFGVDVDATQFWLGGGYAWSFSDSADIYGKLGYTSVEVEAESLGQSVSADDDGLGLSVGLRGRVAQQFELEGALNYVDLSDSGDDTSLGVAGRWFFTEQFSAFAEGEFGDDVTSYGVGMRWTFGGNSGGYRVAEQKKAGDNLQHNARN